MGVAMANSASCGWTSVPSSAIRFWPWTNFRRPRKFSAFQTERVKGLVVPRLESCSFLQAYQEAGGVVQEAAEAAAEVSLQEGGVFRRDGLRVVGQHVGADLNRALVSCVEQNSRNFIFKYIW